MARCLRNALLGRWSPDKVRCVLFGEAAREAFAEPFNAVFVVI
jgi:hypothetical protein